MPDPVFDKALASVWRRYRECAAFARAHQAKYDRLRLWALGLAIAGSVLAAAADQVKRLSAVKTAAAAWPPSPEVILGVASALALAYAAWIAQRLLSGKEANDWVVARAVGEALKSESLRYATRVDPYADATGRPGILLARAAKIRAPAGSLALPQVTDDDAVKNLPAVPMTAAAYDKARASEQRKWYRDNAERHRTKRTRWENVGLILSAVAVALGVLHVIFEQALIAGWLAVLGGVGTAIAAHVAAQRHKTIEDGYRAAAAGLDERIVRWETEPDPESDQARSAFVNDCENTMRTENGAWQAEWMAAPAPAPAPAPTQPTDKP
jgi:hypothetical protein